MFTYKNFHQLVSIFNAILIDIISNFIPNKLVTFDDKDPSMEYIKIKIGKSGNIKFAATT